MGQDDLQEKAEVVEIGEAEQEDAPKSGLSAYLVRSTVHRPFWKPTDLAGVAHIHLF